MTVRSLAVSRAMGILALMGLAAVTVYAGSQITRLIAERRALQNDALLTAISMDIGRMTHEVQKERGASAGFLSSGGANFAEVLPEQRKQSDATIVDLRAAIDTLRQTSQTGAEMETAMDGLLSKLDGLADLRGRVDSLGLEVAEAVGALTTLNRAAIGLLPEIGRHMSNSDAARAVQRHSVFMTAKDIIGLERATGAAGFARAQDNGGVFPPELKQRFAGLIGQQATLLSIYRSIASPDVIGMIDTMEASPEASRVKELRAVVASDDQGGILAVSPEDWFATITRLIEMIKDIEDSGAGEIASHMDEALAAAAVDIRTGILQWVVVAAIFGLTAGYLVRITVASMRATADRVASLADGDIETEILQAPQADLSKITAALENFRTAELERKRTAEQQAELEQASAEGIRRVCAAVSDGDFGARLQLRNLKGPALVLGEGVNQILETAETVVDTQRKRDAALLETQRDEAEAQDRGVRALQKAVRACSSGDFSQRMPVDNLDGLWRDVAEGINSIASMTEDALADIRRIMAALAEGRLDERMRATHKGTFAEISRATNTSLDRLKAAFLGIAEGVGMVGSATRDLRTGAIQLTDRSGEQARTAAESATATDSLSTTIAGNRDNLGRCKELMLALEAKTVDGQEVARNATTTMSRIEGAATEMEKIVATIDAIAFQTNLLAVNASVEAARAGEAGKGFAVVASEVRGLAIRCAEASNQIGALITESVKSINQGVDHVQHTGDAILEIRETLEGVREVIEQVLAVGTRQSDGVDRICAAIGQLDSMAKSNVSLARDNMDHTEKLSQLEQRLSCAVAEFLDHTDPVKEPQAA
ncbi:nitrate- and nitrite sensing domain-containing protein [Sulfitobacter sp. D35]|uniref:methyl-accepting chemotaxis protein n=1 Tax=Sulfitobacter sp. D35 TaxID=3083252 RepID=UPI00296FB0C1|nr:nitrate- and nitrite sensing domain-containing protein [Sulfitobacter sp. D35]MDW4496406.1 nitrate- and nitrite sensing domain-containing protein [Sulfitobacter sp. D35]